MKQADAVAREKAVVLSNRARTGGPGRSDGEASDRSVGEGGGPPSLDFQNDGVLVLGLAAKVERADRRASDMAEREVKFKDQR